MIFSIFSIQGCNLAGFLGAGIGIACAFQVFKGFRIVAFQGIAVTDEIIQFQTDWWQEIGRRQYFFSFFAALPELLTSYLPPLREIKLLKHLTLLRHQARFLLLLSGIRTGLPDQTP